MEEATPTISIIVPAYNEEITVVDTVRSLLTLEYRAYEIIVVDDGSKDRTSEVLAKAFDMHLVHRPIRRQVDCQREEYIYETRAQKVPLTLIRKKNGGKADTLNMGINAANFPYFICMDADSVLQYDSLRRIVQPVLADGNVVAVGGIVRISNDVELENGRVQRYRLPGRPLPDAQKTAGRHAGAGIRPFFSGLPHPVRPLQRLADHLRRLRPVQKVHRHRRRRL